jgi:hypothetical protein
MSVPRNLRAWTACPLHMMPSWQMDTRKYDLFQFKVRPLLPFICCGRDLARLTRSEKQMTAASNFIPVLGCSGR